MQITVKNFGYLLAIGLLLLFAGLVMMVYDIACLGNSQIVARISLGIIKAEPTLAGLGLFTIILGVLILIVSILMLLTKKILAKFRKKT